MMGAPEVGKVYLYRGRRVRILPSKLMRAFVKYELVDSHVDAEGRRPFNFARVVDLTEEGSNDGR